MGKQRNFMEQINKNKIIVPKWSFKVKEDSEKSDLIKSIKHNGQLKNLVVRLLDNGMYEVIDGKVIYEALVDLKKDFIWCVVIKNITELEAKLIYLQLNFNLREDFVEIAKSVKSICEKVSKYECSKFTKFSANEISDLIKINEFDFERYKKEKQKEQSFLI